MAYMDNYQAHYKVFYSTSKGPQEANRMVTFPRHNDFAAVVLARHAELFDEFGNELQLPLGARFERAKLLKLEKIVEINVSEVEKANK